MCLYTNNDKRSNKLAHLLKGLWSHPSKVRNDLLKTRYYNKLKTKKEFLEPGLIIDLTDKAYK